jgi:hypothetical protein
VIILNHTWNRSQKYPKRRSAIVTTFWQNSNPRPFDRLLSLFQIAQKRYALLQISFLVAAPSLTILSVTRGGVSVQFTNERDSLRIAEINLNSSPVQITFNGFPIDISSHNSKRLPLEVPFHPTMNHVSSNV